MAHVRKGDTVIVIAGSNKGKKGKVLRVLPNNRVVVEKVAMVKKHTKPTQKNPQGGIVDKEGSIHISNVQLFDEKLGRGTRTKNTTDGGTKLRVGAKSGTKFSPAGI
jgi:large subunit ribosomal protein L24